MRIPTISVVVPCFNVESYVREAVESVLAQRFPMSEIIAVDDGSTDGTARELQRFASVPRVRIHRTENRGLGPARNAGLELATGEYVYFLDSDDVMAPSFSECLHTVLAPASGAAPPDLVCFSGSNFFDHGYESSLPGRQGEDVLERKDALLRRRVAGRFSSGANAARALWEASSFFPNAYLYLTRRHLWRDQRLRFKPILHEDVELILPLFASAAGVEVITDVLYHRRIRTNSIMTSGLSPKSLAARETILRSMLAYPVAADPNYKAMAPVVAQQAATACRRYFSTAEKLRRPVDWSLGMRAVARLRNVPLAKRLMRIALTSAWRRSPV